MNFVIAGGSGSIGEALVDRLIDQQHTVIVLSRNSRHTYTSEKLIVKRWNGQTLGDWCKTIEHADAVINFSGASIASGRWTRSRRTELFESRILTTRILVRAISMAASRPSVFINASAVGYYGNVVEVEVNENSSQGTGFIPDLCGHWEREAMKAREFGTRIVLLRTGIVLQKNSGALKRMILPFRLFFGGPLGSGSQWLPWIHIDDEIEAILFAAVTKNLQGPINLTAPNPVTMKVFAESLGKLLNRPSWFSVPAFVLKLILGEMSSLVLEGQRALPEQLLKSGFIFTYPTIEKALEEIIQP